MNNLYPLKFKPVFKEKIWGGHRIGTQLGLDYAPLSNCGEAWVLSGVPGSETPVANGFLTGNALNDLVEVFMDDLLGEKVFNRFRTEFPLLIKFIDSNDYLSIQVHPDDALAARRGMGNGKSEMWYILHAEPDAELISGFNRLVDPALYAGFLKQKRLPEILNIEKVRSGDVFNVPAGRIHALGPGILLAEIQQSSDTTYRIYDWDRVDNNGNPRELHTDLALEAIDFSLPDTYKTKYPRKQNQTVSLVDAPWFSTSLIDFNHPVVKDYSFVDSFVIYLCTEGSVVVRHNEGDETLVKGEALLIPAVLDEISLIPAPNCTLLEVFIP